LLPSLLSRALDLELGLHVEIPPPAMMFPAGHEVLSAWPGGGHAAPIA